MFNVDLLMTGLFGAAVLGYVLFVNRRCQTYTGTFILDVSIEEAWELLSTQPGRPQKWLSSIVSLEWSNEAKKEVLALMDEGHECHIKILTQEAPTKEESICVYRWKGTTQLGDVLHCNISLQPAAEGTEVTLTYAIERAQLAVGFLRRLTYPMIIGGVARLVRGHLARERQHEQPAARPRPSATSKAAISLPKQLALLSASVAATVYLFDLGVGIAVIATIIVHEYGHAHAMRRHGHQARFYLIPFFGGIAIGDRTYISDAEATEILLKGPAFGLLPPLACFGGFLVLGDSAWLGAGFVALLVNMFNLLPIPPLDGGRVVQIFLKPMGDKVWFAASGLLILAGGLVAVYLRSKSFLVLLIVTAVFWSMAPKRSYSQRPLTVLEGVTAASAYLALIGMHVAALIWCDSHFDGRLVKALLSF